jgi:hypothetical protein
LSHDTPPYRRPLPESVRLQRFQGERVPGLVAQRFDQFALSLPRGWFATHRGLQW